MVSSDGWLWVFRAGVGFLLLAALLFLLGFATDHWHDNDDVHYGLWNSCDRVRCSMLEPDDLPAYHIATQAFQTMAAICFAFSPIVHLFVYCCKKRKDTGWRSRILDIGYSSGILFHVCSLLIFGFVNSTPEYFSWSYGMSCASSSIAFIGITMIIISRTKALYKFTFRPVNRSKRKTAASEPTAERRFDHTASRSNPFHPQETVIIPSSSEQSHSMRVPDSNVNINISINAGPPNMSSPQQQQQQQQQQEVPSISAAFYAQPHPDNSSNAPTIVPEPQQRLHPKPSDTLADPYPLTQVRPAPKSSIAPYTSPIRNNIFGPADRKKTLESIDNNNLSHFAVGNETQIPSISGRIPSAPPYDVAEFERSYPPPSYSEAVNES